jgi:hypothetical protein
VILLELTTIRCSKIPPASLYHPSSHCKPVPAPTLIGEGSKGMNCSCSSGTQWLLFPRFWSAKEGFPIMAKIRCIGVSDGLRPSEIVAKFADYNDRKHFIRVEQDFVDQEQGSTFLPVGIIHVNPKAKAVLVELPHEAETGINRLWVKEDQVVELVEEFA